LFWWSTKLGRPKISSDFVKNTRLLPPRIGVLVLAFAMLKYVSDYD
jgi:hypothetical protein